MKHLKRILILFLCLVILCGCGLSGCVSVGNGKKVIRIAHAQSETHPEHIGLLKFKEYVEIKLITNDNFSNINQLNMTYTIPYQTFDNEIEPIILNIDYMIDLLDFLYDTNSDTTLKIDSGIKPVHFINDDYTYLLLPMRRD